MKQCYFDICVSIPDHPAIYTSVLMGDIKNGPNDNPYVYALCKQVGETQCCGSLEVFGERSANISQIIEVMKCTDCAVYYFHWKTGGMFDYPLTNLSDEVNQAVAPYFQVKFVEVDDGFLALLDIPDYKLYMEWKKMK